MPPRNIFDSDLDMLIDIARTEYHILSVSDEALQAGYAKTYLWIATAMLAALLGAGDRMMNDGVFLFFFSGHCGTPFYSLWSASLVLSAIVFLYGVDILRGRANLLSFGNFRQMFDLGRQAFREDNGQGLRTAVLHFLDRVVTERTELVSRTGKHLRIMSRLLLGSALCAILSVIAFALG